MKNVLKCVNHNQDDYFFAIREKDQTFTMWTLSQTFLERADSDELLWRAANAFVWLENMSVCIDDTSDIQVGLTCIVTHMSCFHRAE